MEGIAVRVVLTGFREPCDWSRFPDYDLHWVLHREDCSGFRLPGRRLFVGGHRMDLLLPHCCCILARNSRESTRARWALNATERTQPMLDIRLAAQGSPPWQHSFVSTGFRLTIFRE
jgi:hypothetical protein